MSSLLLQRVASTAAASSTHWPVSSLILVSLCVFFEDGSADAEGLFERRSLGGRVAVGGGRPMVKRYASFVCEYRGPGSGLRWGHFLAGAAVTEKPRLELVRRPGVFCPAGGAGEFRPDGCDPIRGFLPVVPPAGNHAGEESLTVGGEGAVPGNWRVARQVLAGRDGLLARPPVVRGVPGAGGCTGGGAELEAPLAQVVIGLPELDAPVVPVGGGAARGWAGAAKPLARSGAARSVVVAGAARRKPSVGSVGRGGRHALMLVSQSVGRVLWRQTADAAGPVLARGLGDGCLMINPEDELEHAEPTPEVGRGRGWESAHGGGVAGPA
jgi:hypothetical protein